MNEKIVDYSEDKDVLAKEMFSEHKDISKYSWKSKVSSLFGMWLFWGIIFGITHVSVVREAIIQFVEENYTVDWLTFWADILLNKLQYVALVFVFGSIVILMSQQKYTTLKIYNQGIGFIVKKTGEELYATYEDINLNYGKWQSSVWVECKRLKIREQFYFKDFSQPDVMENNLERFAVWGPHLDQNKHERV